MKISIISLGCSKNTVDSEYLAGLLEAAGAEIADGPDGADAAVVNTCGFIRPAVEESVDVILGLEELKREGKLKKICVAGCLVNRYGDELKKELPDVDCWAGAEEWTSLARSLGLRPPAAPVRAMLPGAVPWSRYLKVGEGCDTRCSFCTIPSIRGKARSIPLPSLVERAVKLAEEGAKEICLVGQDLTVYGRDLCGKPCLDELLSALDSELPPGVWVRMLYLHPSRITEKFIDFVAAKDRILSYLDIPIQHIHPEILAKMNRPSDDAHIRRIFSYARRADKYFALRTTLLLGFPGETEEHFGSLLDFLEEAMIDRVGAFTFFPEEGAKAALMDGQIPDEIKEARYRRLMELQSEISLERQGLFVGKPLKILVEEVDENDSFAWGRSYRDAPEVDGLVGVSCEACLPEEGQFLEVLVTDAAEHDLFAKIAGE